VGLIDRTLGGAIPVALAWLGKVVGIGNIGSKVKSVILKVRSRLDSVVDKLVGKVKGLIDKLFGKKSRGNDVDKRTVSQKTKDVSSAAREADMLLTLPHATLKSVLERLPSIKNKYRLSTLNLVQEKKQEYHIFAKINPEVTGPSRKLNNQAKAEIKAGTADVRQYNTPYSQLTPKQKSNLKSKLKNRTITKDEFAALDWDRRFSNRRKRGVDRFWASERIAIRNGTPSRNWTTTQRDDILSGKTPQLDGKPIEGHHRYNAIDHPNIADLSENIHPASWDEHFNKWHGGNFRNDTFGVPNNPSYPDNF